jgi:hypothetical protein
MLGTLGSLNKKPIPAASLGRAKLEIKLSEYAFYLSGLDAAYDGIAGGIGFSEINYKSAFVPRNW